ncbi:helix-turn-helix domain-containing protein [Thalassoglobus sp.]|uniref:AraC family transcriptional regulator n=1 Tax=Thalassoglobus sp. TaxID=2795869 RepID=UPI003AA9798D
MDIHLFNAGVLAPVVQFLDQSGSRSEKFLDRARIPAEMVEAGGWVGKKQVYDFTYDVVHKLRCQEAVFSAYLNFEMKHLGPIAVAMQSCKTVKEALEVAARLGSLAYEGSEYYLENDGETTWFCYRESNVYSPGQTYINDMTLAVFYQLIRATADENWRPQRFRTVVDIEGRHRAVEPFEECHTGIHHNSTGMAFPTAFLSRRLHGWKDLTETASGTDWQFGPEGSPPVVEKLYRLLSSQFPSGKLPTLELVGWMIDVSPRTLKRQLKAAGTSYTGLLDRLRFDVACEMLAIPQMTIREIAFELGFSAPNNFVRSFRRMTGTTPGEYRAQCHVDQ